MISINLVSLFCKYSFEMKKYFIGFLLVTCSLNLIAQNEKELNAIKDSLYIHEIQDEFTTDKVLHAEPLFIDLIRDLGARKGEREWNVGLGLMDMNKYDAYTTLVEYEWAPINRLGLEIELPFSINMSRNHSDSIPGSKLNSLKFGAQYSFYVSEKNKMSMAFGYIQEFELANFAAYGKSNLFVGNVYNPFYVIAKRWGSNFHTLIYTGPVFVHHFQHKSVETYGQINTNFHYMIPGTKNFIGVEFNKVLHKNDFDMTIRPQMRVGITDNLLVGIVTGIPISRENERFSVFLRLIYEPKHKEKK